MAKHIKWHRNAFSKRFCEEVLETITSGKYMNIISSRGKHNGESQYAALAGVLARYPFSFREACAKGCEKHAIGAGAVMDGENISPTNTTNRSYLAQAKELREGKEYSLHIDGHSSFFVPEVGMEELTYKRFIRDD